MLSSVLIFHQFLWGRAPAPRSLCIQRLLVRRKIGDIHGAWNTFCKICVLWLFSDSKLSFALERPLRRIGGKALA
jgi:hypothetical protein